MSVDPQQFGEVVQAVKDLTKSNDKLQNDLKNHMDQEEIDRKDIDRKLEQIVSNSIKMDKRIDSLEKTFKSSTKWGWFIVTMLIPAIQFILMSGFREAIQLAFK